MFPTAESLRRSRAASSCALLLLLALTIHAQSPATPSPTAQPTLELPVLVVDHEHRAVADFNTDQFRITTGANAPLAPLTVRKQGNDPLSLAILIDASRDSFHDLHQLSDDLVAMAKTGIFLPSDHISVYAADCTLVRTLYNAPPAAAILQNAVVEAFAQPTLHNGKKSSACTKSVHLWDDIATVVSAMSSLPGRHALLVISSGTDGASKYNWPTVQQYAFDQSVAIFGLRDQRQLDADTFHVSSLSTTRSTGFQNDMEPVPDVRSAPNFDLLCANDGGLTLAANPLFRKDALADIVFLIRSRFILTIPKASYAPGPTHVVKVSLGHLVPYFISATGPTTPLAVPAPTSPSPQPSH